MGCDIHIFVEIQVLGEWLNVEPPRAASFYAQYERIQEIIDDPDELLALAANGRRWFQTEDYEQFTRLAGVCGDGPDPRGLPDDIAHGTRRAYDYDAHDAHSESCLTAEEMLAASEDDDRSALGFRDIATRKTTWWGEWIRELSGRFPTRCVFWFIG